MSSSSSHLLVPSWLHFFFLVMPIYSSSVFDHVSVYRFKLTPFLFLLFLFLCSTKSFMLPTFWSFLHKRKTSLVKPPLNYGHIQKSTVHCSFSFLSRFSFQSKYNSCISTLFSPVLYIQYSQK